MAVTTLHGNEMEADKRTEAGDSVMTAKSSGQEDKVAVTPGEENTAADGSAETIKTAGDASAEAADTVTGTMAVTENVVSLTEAAEPGVGIIQDKESKRHKDKKMKKEKKEKTPRAPMDKKKKKKVIRRFVLGGVAVACAVFMVSRSIAAKNAPMMVYTMPVTVEDIEETMNTSGTVKSEESRTYFAPLSVKIGTVDVAAGDSVKKGQKLLGFDETALAEAKQVAQLNLQANEGGYASSIHKDNQYQAKLGEANVNLEVLDQQIADNENYLNELKKKAEDKKAWYANQGALLQVSLLEWEKKINDEKKALEERNAQELKDGVDDDDKEKKEKDEAAKGQIAADEEIYLNLQEQVQYNSYDQQNNQEIRDIEREIAAVEKLIGEYEAYRSEMKSQKETSESSAMDQGSRSQLEANTEKERIENQDDIASIEEVESGVTAEFDGVVTEVEAVEGATPQEGEKLITLESTEKVKVEISVSKYDLEKIKAGQEASIDIAGKVYDGKVTKINRMATTNASGAAVVAAEIEILNPDTEIYLGVEARVVIHISKVTDAVAIPVELINADKEGDFVFVVENGVVVKKRLTLGISSDVYSEVKEGLSEGEQVIMTNGQELEEGMQVTAVGQ